MKTIAFLAGLAALAAVPVLAAEPEGLWKTEVKEDGKYLHVRVAACEGAPATLCGTITGAFGGADDSIVGRRIIWDMEPDGPGAWDDGTIWAPDDDETYSSAMELTSPAVLRVEGCILGGLVCRGQDWTRVE